MYSRLIVQVGMVGEICELVRCRLLGLLEGTKNKCKFEVVLGGIDL